MEWEMVCRVCLQGGDMVSLFDCDENNDLLSDKYMYCSSIEVSETEPLPSNICLICVDRLMSAYQFKQQCVSSHETLRECLQEFQRSNAESSAPVKKGMEVITIKQENGVYLQYEIPVEDEVEHKWPVAEQPIKRKRGRPRKYPDETGQIATSPYTRKDVQVGTQNLVVKLKQEPQDDEGTSRRRAESPLDDGEMVDYTTDPDYLPAKDEEDFDRTSMEISVDPKDGSLLQLLKRSGLKFGRRGRPRKQYALKEDRLRYERGASVNVNVNVLAEEEEEEDVLLKETIMANSEPVADGVMNPQPRERKKYPKKKYYYEKIHTCEQCGSSFRSNASLQAHIRRHLGIKPFVCSICGYSCVLNMELRRHMMRHTGVKPYKCRICDRFFGDFGSRQKHERLHLGERPYQCTLCGKSFTYSYVLSNHMLTHTGEKKYACQPCNKRFTKAHHLKYHNKVHHKDLYNQQMLLQESKKVHMLQSNINITDLTSVCTEELLGLQSAQIDGETIQIQVESIDQRDEGASDQEYQTEDNDHSQKMEMDEDGQELEELEDGEQIHEDDQEIDQNDLDQQDMDDQHDVDDQQDVDDQNDVDEEQDIDDDQDTDHKDTDDGNMKEIHIINQYGEVEVRDDDDIEEKTAMLR